MRLSSSLRSAAFTANFALVVLAGLVPLAADPLAGNADTLAVEISTKGGMPVAPEGVTDIKFSDLFVSPVGPRGLELTDKIKALDGKRVRLLGYMVRQSGPTPGVMMLAPFKLSTNEQEYGLCDDLPPTVVFVHVPKYSDLAVPFTPGALLLTGRLELGRRSVGADERIGFLHLLLDDEPLAATVSAAVAPASR